MGEYQPRHEKSFEPEMVTVPAGYFQFGTFQYGDEPSVQWVMNTGWAKEWLEKGWLDRFRLLFSEGPQLTIYLPDYAIGKYPVTVGQYRYFVEAGGYRERRYWTDAGWQFRWLGHTEPGYWNDDKWTGDNRLPVVGVSWYEAYAYCRWLAEATGRDYRLPTEAEWEKAARGTDGRIYPWGNEYVVGYANIDEGLDGGKYLGRTTPVGAYPKCISPYGAYDMSGNVWEWCLSKFSRRLHHPEDNDPEGDAPRVLRGGSWGFDQGFARCSSRYWGAPNGRNGFSGFRVVCGPFPPDL